MGEKYPECQKLALARLEAQSLGLFLEWLQQYGVTLGTHYNFDRYGTTTAEQCETLLEEGPPRRTLQYGTALLEPHPFEALTIEKLLALYLEIDTHKVEDERQAMLEELSHESLLFPP